MEAELWRIELTHLDGSVGYADDCTYAAAEAVRTAWANKECKWVQFCQLCPVDDETVCPHPTGHRFHLLDITNLRVMPMREAI